MTSYIAIICVLGIAIGQLLFKWGATFWRASGSLFEFKTFVTLFSAFALYGITTLAWVWVLQRMELGRTYPLMALAFVLVPLGSYLFFGERFQPFYFVGIFMILVGIMIAVRN